MEEEQRLTTKRKVRKVVREERWGPKGEKRREERERESGKATDKNHTYVLSFL